MIDTWKTANCMDCGTPVRITNKRCRTCYVKASKQFRNKGNFIKGVSSWNAGTHIQTNTGRTHFRFGFIPKTKGTGVPKPLLMAIRQTPQYRIWKSDIFTRDSFTCQECFKRGGDIHAHHIKPFNLIVIENSIKTIDDAIRCEELWNINNGKTLCRGCHMTLHGLAKA